MQLTDNSENTVASTQRTYEITSKDLPLCCPMPNMRLWDSHPRVYMPIEVTGKETCPYCGSTYVLIDFQENEQSE